jgi:Leucine-rich repeat (LRR) protein
VPFVSSSIELANTIKSLDMSLPSYSDIKDSKASVENVKSLSIDAPIIQQVEKKEPVMKKGVKVAKPKAQDKPAVKKFTMPTYDF